MLNSNMNNSQQYIWQSFSLEYIDNESIPKNQQIWNYDIARLSLKEKYKKCQKRKDKYNKNILKKWSLCC